MEKEYIKSMNCNCSEPLKSYLVKFINGTEYSYHRCIHCGFVSTKGFRVKKKGRFFVHIIIPAQLYSSLEEVRTWTKVFSVKESRLRPKL